MNKTKLLEDAIASLIYDYECDNDCKVTELQFTPRYLTEEVNFINTENLMSFRGRLVTAKVSVKIEEE